MAAAPLINPASVSPTISLDPSPATPGSYVLVNGTGFGGKVTKCSISSNSSNLFGATPLCFGGNFGNITGIFQVNSLALEGVYTVVANATVVINDEQFEQTAPAPLTIAKPPVTKTILTTIWTTIPTTITQTTSATPERLDMTVPQAIITVSSTAVVTALSVFMYVIHKGVTIRIDRRGMRRPGFAFDVEVRSGVDREQGSN